MKRNAINSVLTEEEAIEQGPVCYQTVKPTKTYEDSKAERHSRILYAAEQHMRHLPQLEPHEGVCAIVGAAPTIGKYIKEIKEIQKGEFNIVASLNGAHNYLVNNEIFPNIHVIFEIDLKAIEESLGGPLNHKTFYYICSHCDQHIFDQVRDYNKVLWHCFDEPPEYQKFIGKHFPGEFMVGGGHVTFFRTINIAVLLGYRNFEFFGCDGSYEGPSSHYEGYHSYSGEMNMDVIAGAEGLPFKKFRTNPSLSFMTHEFLRFCEVNQGLKIKVHGNGLMRYLHQQVYPDSYSRQE